MTDESPVTEPIVLPYHHYSLWNSTRTDRLIVLHGMGWSAGMIARDLGEGLTRSAILGRIHRLRMNKVIPDERVKKRVVLPRLRQERAPRVRARPVRSEAPVQLEPVVIVDVQDDLIPLGQRKQLEQLDNIHCRWIVGDPMNGEYFYCADPTADVIKGRPYCAAHSRRAYGSSTFTAAERVRYAQMRRQAGPAEAAP